jgi:hypothetical protein
LENPESSQSRNKINKRNKCFHEILQKIKTRNDSAINQEKINSKNDLGISE